MTLVLDRTIRFAVLATVAGLVAVALFALPSVALAGDGLVDFEDDPVRLGGADRFATSALVAAEAFPGWAGVEHVVVASGDQGIPDALTASGLCWAYDAPLLLVSTRRLPPSVRSALQGIAAASPGVLVHVVGGPAPVPAARIREIEAIVGAGRVRRVWGSDRFETARAVALAMRDAASAGGRALSDVALLANGSNDAHVVDALVMSALSSRHGMPLLLLRNDAVPPATARTISELGLSTRWVAGGSHAVSARVVSALGAERVAGVDRYATSAAIASAAFARGWVSTETVGVAATVPDALAGGPLVGRSGGALVLSRKADLDRDVAVYLDELPDSTRAYVFGGPAVVDASVVRQLTGAPAPPRLISVPAGAGACAARIPLVIETGVNTVRVAVKVNGRLVARRDAGPFASVDLGEVASATGRNTVELVAQGADGTTSRSTRRLERFPYAWDTYIVVDKSDYRLYWVEDGVLAEVYPIAHGRNGCTPVGTWRIDAKYHTSPGSVYGPRKMRMFRQVGPGRFAFTAYAIHGTNQPWVIGTQASAGCIRMYNSDISELFPKVPLRTMVVTRQ